ncbi:MAG: tetratricopeptide repeat protein [Phycisphaerales bacterium]
MALRKERDRRYASPQALADDIHRYLDGRPLRAAPDSRAYLARKFVRRNKVQVLAATAVFAALTGGLAVALWQRNEAITSQKAEAKEHARADERAIAAEKAEEAEKDRADQLKKVSDFQSQMLSQIDTTTAGVELMTDVRERFAEALDKSGVVESDRTKRVDALQQELVRVNATDTAAAMIERTILKPAIKAIDEQFKDDPKTHASLRQALADLYETIGLYDAAMPLQESALNTRRRVLGDEHWDTLGSIGNMANLLREQGKHQDAIDLLVPAEPAARKAFTGSNARRLADFLTALARARVGVGFDAERFTLAEPNLLEAHSIHLAAKDRGPMHKETLGCVQGLVDLYTAWDKAEPGKGYDAKAAEWQAKLDAANAETNPAEPGTAGKK